MLLMRLLDQVELIDNSFAICSDMLFKGLEGCNFLFDAVQVGAK